MLRFSGQWNKLLLVHLWILTEAYYSERLGEKKLILDKSKCVCIFIRLSSIWAAGLSH